MSNIEWTDPRQRVATLSGGHPDEIARLQKPLPSFAQERIDRATLRASMLLFASRYSVLELEVLFGLAMKDLGFPRATGGEA